jgi:hypothetical protein
MRTLFAVGVRITDGAKAFLHKEYIYLTIWSCSFAIVLGCTVDLLEMSMKRAPTNFPYTAVSFLTGSMTSIAAGYIGMRIAVYTNIRVTFQCCTSVHKGFVTAFRGGQVLGFVLVGLGILNIMILVLIFKAAWYNKYLEELCVAGKPFNQCPAGDNKGFVAANAELKSMFDAFALADYHKWYDAMGAWHTVYCPAKTPLPDIKTATEADLTAYFKAHPKCPATHDDFMKSGRTCEYGKGADKIQYLCTGATW